MAALTFTQLRQEVVAMAGGYLNDTAGLLRVGRWVNQSYREVCDQAAWPFLEATSTGTAPLTISDLGSVRYVLDTTTKSKLTEISIENLTEMFPDQTVTGSPSYYTITTGNVITAYPASTSHSLTVGYYKDVALLSADGDTPIIPEAYQDLIVLGAARRAMLDDEATGTYQAIRAEYDARLADMRAGQLRQPMRQVITAGSEDY